MFYSRLIVFMAVSTLAASVSAKRSDNDEPPTLPRNFSSGDSSPPPEEPYWKQLRDPSLDALIARGLAQNGDIEVARQRAHQAEAVARQMLSSLLPTVSAEASYNISPFNNVGMGLDLGLGGQQVPKFMATGVGETQARHSVSTVLKANYLVDIVGKNTAAFRGARRDLAATSADGQTLASNVAFLITQAYLDIVAAKQRLGLIEQQIQTNEALLELVEAGLDRGSADALEVLQQRQQLIATRAQLPLVQSIIATGKNQLAILTGSESASTLPEIPAQLPKFQGDPVVGVPGRLLTARPDLRASAERLHAAHERKKNAARALLPTLMLTGQVGYVGNYIDQYDDGETWGFGAFLTIPLYEGGRNWAALDQARASVAGAQSARRQAALSAMEEVESSLARYQASKTYRQAVGEQLKASRLTFEEAQRRYAAGLVDYLNVLVILAAHQQLELAEVQAEHDMVMSHLGVQRSLGGKWTNQLLGEKVE